MPMATAIQSGLDCDDGNPDIRPGAPEICGDGIDQDCSGADVPEAACDLDGDGFSALEGDCDDTNRRVFPGAFERCNGRDDNCAEVWMKATKSVRSVRLA